MFSLAQIVASYIAALPSRISQSREEGIRRHLLLGGGAAAAGA